MITSKTRETRHSGALSRVQDNKPASPHIGCCLTPKCPQINSNGNLPRPSSLGVTAISTGGGGYVDCPPLAKLSGMHVRSLKLKPVHQQALRQLT